MAPNVPAIVGMALEEVDTPCLLVDLDAFERNVETMRRFVEERGIRLRAHAKSHKSADIAKYQIEKGGACGICCQKVSEAEPLVEAGVRDVLISNQVVAPAKIQRLADLARRARVLVCVDDADNVGELAAAARKHAVTLECLVEIDVGAGRCGVLPGGPAVALAKAVNSASGLKFSGIQAYQGAAQHIHDFKQRKASVDAAVSMVASTLAMLEKQGLECSIVTGAGTGSYRFEAASGLFDELQCGSYVFMDADYQRVLNAEGTPIDEFENSLFIQTSIMSKTRPATAICDAGLKAHSVDSGMPVVHGREDLVYLNASDEHGVIADRCDVLKLNDRLMLVPGHCDPTVNLHDWLVGIRGGRVEALWPVSARGMVF